MVARILKVTNDAGIQLVINDHPKIARDIGAPLAHLGQEDFLEARRSLVPPGQAIGLSTHAPAQAERATAAGAAYIAIGPVNSTPTTPTAETVTLDYVRWAAGTVRIPLFATGGKTTIDI